MSRPYICIIYNWTLHCELKFSIKLLLFWMSKSQMLYRQGSSMINFSVWSLNHAHISQSSFVNSLIFKTCNQVSRTHTFVFYLSAVLFDLYCNIIYSLRLGLNISWLQCDISHLRVPPLLIIKSKHASILLFKTFFIPLL